MEIIVHIALFAIAYLAGALPMSIIVGKITKGVDIRDYGSGNPGTTNAIRVLGRKLGMVVFLLDVLKGGFVIVLLRAGLFESYALFHPLAYGIFAAIGHTFPVFLKFKGGKAVATSVGIFLFYAPVLGVLGLLGFLAALRLTHYVSVGSLTGASTLLVSALYVFFFGPKLDSGYDMLVGYQGDVWMLAIATLGVSLIFIRHRKNFINLKNGTEPKSTYFQKKKDDA